MADFKLSQGVSYNIPIKPKTEQGEYILAGDIVKIDFAFGNVLKTYPSEDIQYKNDAFVVQLSRKDTLSIPLGVEKHLQADIYFKDGNNKLTNCKTFVMEHNHFLGGGNNV